MFVDHFYFKPVLEQKVSMDPVHYMGSMDGPDKCSMDRSKMRVHVLSSPPDKYLGRWAPLELTV